MKLTSVATCHSRKYLLWCHISQLSLRKCVLPVRHFRVDPPSWSACICLQAVGPVCLHLLTSSGLSVLASAYKQWAQVWTVLTEVRKVDGTLFGGGATRAVRDHLKIEWCQKRRYYLVPPQPPALLKRLKNMHIWHHRLHILRPEKQIKHLKTSEEKEDQITFCSFRKYRAYSRWA